MVPPRRRGPLKRAQPGADPPADAIARFAKDFRAGRLEGALQQAKALAKSFPRSPVAHEALAATLVGLGQLEPAAAAYGRLAALDPKNAAARFVMGGILADLNRMPEAVDAYRAGLALQPRQPEILNNLGNALQALDRFAEAADAYRTALALKPDYARAHNNLGNTLMALGRREEALVCYGRALAAEPGYARAHYNRGVVLDDLGKPEEAASAYRAAIAADPRHAGAHANLAAIHQNAGRVEAAVEAYDAVLAIDPGDAEARAQRLHLLGQLCAWDQIAAEAATIPALGVETAPVSPFACLALEDDPARHRVRSERYAATLMPRAATPIAARPKAPDGRIAVGYFSSDFHDHATLHLMARLLELHDRQRFRIVAYSFGRDADDAYRARAIAAVDCFRKVRGLGDADLADLARADGIDIAVDLKGYTKESRPGVFARRAAADQVSYLGYPGTLGMAAMDYLVADRILAPPDLERCYSEKIIRMPASYQANDATRAIARGPTSRAAQGLPDSGFVFACFNQAYKISPAEFDIWMLLLRQVDGAVLWLLRPLGRAEANLRRAAEARGVAAERIVFADRTTAADHLARHALADLVLDTFAYNAHTTASDALWAGAPVLTRIGQGFAARVAASLLHAVGLEELVVDSAAGYEALARDLARDPTRIRALKARLAAARTTAPLFDSAGFARSLESAYETVRRRRLEGRPPESFDVVQPP